MSLRPICAN